MSPEITGLVFLAVLLALVAIGVNIGLSLAICGVLGILIITGNIDAAVGILRTTPYETVANFALIVIPLFILMGEFTLQGGIGQRAYQALNTLIGKLPGGLSIATTWASTAFGATSGSAIACASVFTKVSLPEMRKAGYEPNLACAAIASSSPIAMLIPPSIFLIVYGMLADQSIAMMLIAGIFPGLLMAITLSIGIWLLALRKPNLIPRSNKIMSWREKLASIAQAWPMLILAVIILGGIYTGVFAPTEASAIGAFAALIICLILRTLDWNKVKNALVDTAFSTAQLAFVIVGATIFARFLSLSGITTWSSNFIVQLGLSPFQFVVALVIILVILGCFIDALSAMFITIPIFFPIVHTLGIDPIWLGICVVLSLNLGLITPPFALSVYTVSSVAGSDVTAEGIFKSAIPFYLFILLCLIIIVLFPQVSTFLPNNMLILN